MIRLLFVVVAVSSAFVNLDDDWFLFKKTYRKKYAGEDEESERRWIWESNLKYIDLHNMAADRGLHSFWLGMNEYGDMTIEEFVEVMNGLRMTNETKARPVETDTQSFDRSDFPTEVDWRNKGYVTPIKNQKQCGSCWAFSATGSLEGQHFNRTGQLVSLSEQNLVDCSRKEGNFGCLGGLMDQAFQYIKINNGIDTEVSYPYKAKDEKCHFNRANVGATDTGYVDIPKGNELALQAAVANIGPISVGIDASHISFQLYKKGVYDEKKCSTKKLDHGVLAVGYGSEASLGKKAGGDYWLVKNSWGTSWGMEGYIMMSRNNNNQCGIATQASHPTVPQHGF